MCTATQQYNLPGAGYTLRPSSAHVSLRCGAPPPPTSSTKSHPHIALTLGGAAWPEARDLRLGTAMGPSWENRRPGPLVLAALEVLSLVLLLLV